MPRWRRARVECSPSPDAYPHIFHPRLELFPRLASRVVDFPRVLAACPCGFFAKARRLSRHFPPAPRIDFSRRLAARPCEILTKPWHQSGHFPPNPRVVGFSSGQVATVSDFHQALAPSWAFFCTFPEQLTFRVWYFHR